MLTLQFCVNYGGRAEIVDAAREIARAAQQGRLDPDHLTEKSFRKFLDEPEIPDVDLFVRSSGEQRTSNFLLWQSAYAEMVFLDRLWPDFDRRDLWRAIELYASRDRRYGGAEPNAIGSGLAAGLDKLDRPTGGLDKLDQRSPDHRIAEGSRQARPTECRPTRIGTAVPGLARDRHAAVQLSSTEPSIWFSSTDPSICVEPPLCPTATLRGLASSATGMVRVSTPSL